MVKIDGRSAWFAHLIIICLFVFDQQTNTTWNLEFTSTPGHDNSVGFGGLNPQDFVLYNGDVYFVGTSGTADGGTKTTLWTTNGDMSALIPDTFAVGGIDGGGSNIPPTTARWRS
jgi:predicted heme/steroid binding protein